MIDRYLKDEKVTIHDNYNGTYSIPYQDNIDELVNIKNEIDVLSEALDNVNQTNFLMDDLINILKGIIYVFGAILMSVLGSVSNIPILAEGMPYVAVILGISYGRKVKKNNISREEGLELQKNYLQEEIEKKKYQKVQLLREKSHKDNLIKEEVVVLDIIKKKKELLEHTLNLLMDYKMNQEYFRKNFDKHTLEKVLDSEEDTKIIQDVIIKEIRR